MSARIHSRSFWLGAHASLLIVGLTTLPLSWYVLPTVAISSIALMANWSAMKREQQ